MFAITGLETHDHRSRGDTPWLLDATRSRGAPMGELMQFPWESCARGRARGPSRRINDKKMKFGALPAVHKVRARSVPWDVGISSLMNIRLWGPYSLGLSPLCYAQPAHDMATECAEKGHARRAKVRLG